MRGVFSFHGHFPAQPGNPVLRFFFTVPRDPRVTPEDDMEGGTAKLRQLLRLGFLAAC
jgi:hypothetical protein